MTPACGFVSQIVSLTLNESLEKVGECIMDEQIIRALQMSLARVPSSLSTLN